MRVFFAVIAIGLILGAVCGAAMAWDGSFQFFMTLNSQSLSVPHNRLIALPAQAIVLLLSHLTDNIGLLQASFGLVYVLIIVGILATCWWILRRTAPALFVWVALGVGLGTLPGLFPIYSEATLAVQLFWPILLAIITGLHERTILTTAILAVVIFFTHPLAILLFLLAALVASLVGQFHKRDRAKLWLWAVVFIGAALLRTAVLEPGYESDQLSLEVVSETFNLSVAGLPLLALVFSWLVALLLFLELNFSRLRQHNMINIVYSAVAGCMAIGAGLFIVWSYDILNWRYALGFRTWVLFCSLPFMGLAVIEGLLGNFSIKETAEHEWYRRLRIVKVVAVVFSLVMAIQSTGWLSATDKFRQVIAQSSSACISMDSISWLAGTPIYHPSATTYSILLQGRTPKNVVLGGNDCVEADFATGFPIANWDRAVWANSWFDMQYLSENLMNEQREPGGT